MTHFDIQFDSPVSAVDSVEALVRAPLQSTVEPALQLEILKSVEQKLGDLLALTREQDAKLQTATTELATMIAMTLIRSDDALIKERITNLVREAVRSMNSDTAGLKLVVNPEDIALFPGAELDGLQLVEDAGLSRGDFRIENTGRGLLGSLEHQLDLIVDHIRSGGDA